MEDYRAITGVPVAPSLENREGGTKQSGLNDRGRSILCREYFVPQALRKE